MKLHFDDNISYQIKAINSVINIFKGQEINRTEFTVTKENNSTGQTLIPGLEESELGIGNKLELSDQILFKNLINVQSKNGLKKSRSLFSGDFTIEMETGTGKTYVYLRTIFELNKMYGFSKFIIVVPSIAIKEGVYKNLQITQEHFENLYPNAKGDDIKKTPKFLSLRVPKLFYMCKMNFMINIGLNNKKLIYDVKKKNKKDLISRLKSLSVNQICILILYNYYDAMFRRTYVSDGSIGRKVGVTREWVNKSKWGKLAPFLEIESRGYNRTCITVCNINLLKDPELMIYFMNEIRALAGVFKYEFTRFLKISYLNIINNINSSNNWLKEIEILGEFAKLVVSDQLRSLKLSLKEEIVLSVFPQSAINYAWSLYKSYPSPIRHKFRFLYSMAKFFCLRHKKDYFNNLSLWFFRITNLKYEDRLGAYAPKGVGCKRGQDAKPLGNIAKENPKEEGVAKGDKSKSFLAFLEQNEDIKQSFVS